MNLRFNSEDSSRPFCVTDFGTYRAGFFTFPIYADIELEYAHPDSRTTVYWAKLDDAYLYRGFDVDAAFAAMDQDYRMRAAGSLLTSFINMGEDAA